MKKVSPISMLTAASLLLSALPCPGKKIRPEPLRFGRTFEVPGVEKSDIYD